MPAFDPVEFAAHRQTDQLLEQCNGRRPVCTSCEGRKLQCSYISKDRDETRTMALKRELEVLKEASKPLEELVEYLQRMPEDIAQVILQRLRASDDPKSVLQSIRTDVLGNQISEEAAFEGLSLLAPTGQSEIEDMKLATRHLTAYPGQEHPANATAATDHHQSPPNPDIQASSADFLRPPAGKHQAELSPPSTSVSSPAASSSRAPRTQRDSTTDLFDQFTDGVL